MQLNLEILERMKKFGLCNKKEPTPISSDEFYNRFTTIRKERQAEDELAKLYLDMCLYDELLYKKVYTLMKHALYESVRQSCDYIKLMLTSTGEIQTEVKVGEGDSVIMLYLKISDVNFLNHEQFLRICAVNNIEPKSEKGLKLKHDLIEQEKRSLFRLNWCYVPAWLYRLYDNLALPRLICDIAGDVRYAIPVRRFNIDGRYAGEQKSLVHIYGFFAAGYNVDVAQEKLEREFMEKIVKIISHLPTYNPGGSWNENPEEKLPLYFRLIDEEFFQALDKHYKPEIIKQAVEEKIDDMTLPDDLLQIIAQHMK